MITRTTKLIPNLLILIFLSPGCAVIVGGSKYNAIVKVEGGESPTIYYKGNKVGTGSAVVKIPRKDADKLVFAVKEDECEEQQFSFTSRKFRGWAFVGSLFTFSIITNDGIPIPVGSAVDLALGANWKPNSEEIGIQKLDYKNFQYTLDYSGCKSESKLNLKETVLQKLEALKDLFEKGEITKEEYNSARKKVLEL